MKDRQKYRNYSRQCTINEVSGRRIFSYRKATFFNRDYFQNNKEENSEKERRKIRRQTNTNCRLIRNMRYRICRALKGNTNLSST